MLHRLVHWKPDIRCPFVPEKMVLYGICSYIVDTLHALVLGKSSLISYLFLYPAFLYPVSSVIRLRRSKAVPFHPSLNFRSSNAAVSSCNERPRPRPSISPQCTLLHFFGLTFSCGAPSRASKVLLERERPLAPLLQQNRDVRREDFARLSA